MKSNIFIFFALFSILFLPNVLYSNSTFTNSILFNAVSDCSTYEAQFIATVNSIETFEKSICHAFLSFENSNSLYYPNMICPLDIDEVYRKGIYISGDTKSSSCGFLKNQQISGVLVRSSISDKENIYLEQ